MHYYLSLTSKCNLLCKYCYGKSCEDYMTFDESVRYDFNIPQDTSVTTSNLKNLAKDDDDFIITFYGGEPLLKIDMIKKILDENIAKEYMIQTNGIFLDKLEPKYTNMLSTILLSIDGTRKHTNERRGEGVYEKVTQNANLIRQNGFKGEIIARMTVDETCDIYENVTYLFENDDFKFTSVHFQLDAQFWSNDYSTRNFGKWVNEKYNPKIKKLIDFWYEKIEKENKVLRIYPFVGIMQTLLTDQKEQMRCGAGHSVLGIQTNGKIVACPITAGYKPLYMGDVKTSTLNQIKKNAILPENPCPKCEIYDICGGRCLYASKTKYWGDKGFNEVCLTIFFLVDALREKLPSIEEKIKIKQIKLEDFNYIKYNGCEIIP